MILLSRIIKYGSVNHLNTTAKEIKLKNVIVPVVTDDGESVPINYFAEEQVEAIIEQTNVEAKAIIEAARFEKDHLEKQIQLEKAEWETEKHVWMQSAYQEGFDAGQVEGRESGFSEYIQLIDEAKNVIDQAKQSFMSHIDNAETVILELAISAAEKIIHSTLNEEPDKYIPLVKNALKEARDFKEVQIHVHPAKYEELIDAEEELQAIFPHEVQCYIYPDADLDEHACFIESENGRIDASVDTQLSEIKKALVELLGELS